MDFKQHLQNIYGLERSNSILDSLTKEATLCFRLNEQKVASLIELTAGLKPHPIVPNAFYTDVKLGKSPYHHAGAIYIQDASAMLVGHLLPINNNDIVLDLCAAPGGKTTQVATKLTSGYLIANDISYNRAKILSQNVERLGLKNVFVTNNNPSDFLKAYQGYFDKVILDAPCSGEGMFRKNEFAELDWSHGKVLSCAVLQKELILCAYKLLRKGGVLSYSTCTFSTEENEEIVNYLLANTSASLIPIPNYPNCDRGIRLNETLRILPDKFQGEGQFIALIRSNDTYDNNYYAKKPFIKKEDFYLFKEFVTTNLNLDFELTHLHEKDGDIYYLPINEIPNLKVLRFGWLLGSIANKRFIPAHALALGATEKDFKHVYNIDNDLEITKYLHGETLSSNIPNGYILLTYKGISLGLGKVTNNIIKNLYPKGLRQ
ncbi:MAG: RsmB/NOP family class I SAM-dependent RNA methyltransferase [Sphaerochaetaceae bacterium]|nr:RsmB/NOP family class I SAM-dependent RNA methyltransferase [Bacilli bacterium]MDD4219859.1 RsmB/NOP family class I SAM-dependent RNA methyltransferase [Sphaerochaetaceae bacterium]